MPNSFSSASSSNNAFGILKQFYVGSVVSQFNDDMPLYREIEKAKVKMNGSQVNTPVKVRRNQGIGAVAEGGLLPSIGQQTVVQATITMKNNYLRFGITGQMLKASQGDKGSFVNALEYEMTQGLADLKKTVNRQLFWDGTSDLAVVSANAVASNTVTVTGRESAENGNKFLDVGMMIDIYSSAGVLVASSIQITALSGTTTATLTVSPAVSCSSTDIVVMAGSFNNEISGLLYTLDGGTGTIYGINRSTYPIMQANAISNSGQTLNLNFMKQGWNQGKSRGGAKYDAVYCDYDSERFYEKLLTADRRFINKVPGNGTFSDKNENYLEYGGIPVVADPDCPQRFFFLDSSQWKKFVLCELEWADEQGADLIPQTSTDAYEARLRLMFDLWCEKASAQVALSSYVSP